MTNNQKKKKISKIAFILLPTAVHLNKRGNEYKGRIAFYYQSFWFVKSYLTIINVGCGLKVVTNEKDRHHIWIWNTIIPSSFLYSPTLFLHQIIMVYIYCRHSLNKVSFVCLLTREMPQERDRIDVTHCPVRCSYKSSSFMHQLIIVPIAAATRQFFYTESVLQFIHHVSCLLRSPFSQ